MRTRLIAVSLLVAAVALFLSRGGSRKVAGLFVATSPDEVRASLRGPLQALRAGQPQQALSALVGAPVDAQRWARADHALADQAGRSGGSAVDQCRRNLLALSQAIELYRADEAHGYRLPQSLGDLVGEGGLASLPECPAAARDTYTAGYRPDSGNETFSLCCSGRAHKVAGMRPDYPRYDRRYGVLVQSTRTSSWWPAPYRVELVSIERLGPRATVKLKENGVASVRIGLRKNDAGAWVLDGDGLVEDGGSMLGALLSTWQVAAGTASSETSVGSEATCARSLARVATALEEWSSDHDGRYPPTLDALVPTYLPQLPPCAGEGAAGPRYKVSSDAREFDLSCGGPHGDAHLTNHSSRPRADQQLSLRR